MARKGRIAANLLAQRAAPSAPLARLFGSGSTKSALEWPKCWRIRSAADRGRTAPAAGEYALLRIIIKLVRVFFVCLVLLAIGGGAMVGLTIWYFGRDLPDYQQLAHYEPPITTRVHAGDGRLLAEYSTERRVFMPIGAIPKKVIQAFLSAEDKNFYSHRGVDPVSMLRAALTDLGRWHSKRRPVGASTITQQVAKNMLLSNELTMSRKIKEVLLATRIEEALSKDRILELYLNEIYLGSGAYGVEAAALIYFNKSLDELTLGEAAFLAGLPKAPNNYNPARYPQQAKARRDWVLDRMAEDGSAPEKEIVAARAEPLTPGAATAGWQLAVVLRTESDGAAIGLKDGGTGRIPFAQMRWARPLHDDGNLGALPRTAADVVKPGDLVLVEPLTESLKGGPPAGKAQPAPVRPAGLYNLCQIPEVSGALVALDPHTGRVLAMSGGFSYEISQFNRATQAKRQPGSSIKPFVYLTALEHGFTPSSVVEDGPVAISQGEGMPLWTPGNYNSNKFRGPTPLRLALELSLNTVTARLAETVGMEAIGETIEKFGIMDHMPRLYAMSLGAGETTPLRHTAAYAMLDNGGKRITPTLIDRVQGRDGKTIFSADQRPCEGCTNVEWNHQAAPVVPDTREQIADPVSTFQIVEMLEGVVQRGTGTAVKAVGKPIAGKTASTNAWQDAWSVGFTPALAAGVSVGYHDPVNLGSDETGGHLAAPIFRDFMLVALKDVPAKEFRTPPGLKMYRVK